MMSDKKCVILKDYDFEDCEKEDFERLLLLCGENIDTAVFILWYDYTELDFKKSDKFKYSYHFFHIIDIFYSFENDISNSALSFNFTIMLNTLSS